MPSPLPGSATGSPLQEQQGQLHHRRANSPLPPYLQHLHDSQPVGDRAQSVPPQHQQQQALPLDSAHHRASPAADTAAAAANLAKRRTTVHHIDNVTTSKRPMSPHITSATPTSASVRHSALTNTTNQHDRRSSLPGINVGTGPLSPAFAGTSAISKRDSVHSPLSASHHHHHNPPWLHDAARFVTHISDGDDHDDDDDDDEAGKGHGGRMSVPPGRPDSRPLFPLTLSPQPHITISSSSSSSAAPALLAPSAPLITTTGLSPQVYGPLSADNSSKLLTASPIIVPQARRGAINLKSKASLGSHADRKRRRRRRARRKARRAAEAAAAVGTSGDGLLDMAAVAERHHHRRLGSNETEHSSQSGRYGPYYTSHHRRTHTNEAASYPLSHRPALSSMRSIASILFFNTVAAFLHPQTTARRIGCWFMRTCREVDDAFRDPRTRERVWKPEWLDAYVPFLIWLAVSLGSTGTVIVFHTKVFTALDELSQTLQRLGLGGQFVMGGLIFLTTFPPMPLYSTLIVLCGFSFGMIEGFIISYIAALSGAITVFILSRTMLKGWMQGLLNKSGGLKKVVRAIEKQPKLLFLIRLAPYPYNLMNTLLASSPTLTFRTYTTCTALALPKLLVHTGLGTSIKNFAAYHGAENGSGSGEGLGSGEESEEEKARSATAERVKRIAGLVGVVLCIGIFFYLMHVARKAVDGLDDENLAVDPDGEKEARVGRGRGASSRRRRRRRRANVGARSSASAGSSFSVRGGAGPSVEAERQRLFTGDDLDFDEDEEEDGDSLYSDDSALYSDDDDDDFDDSEDEDDFDSEEDEDEDDLPALDGGRAGEDGIPGSSSTLSSPFSHHHQRPAYGRTPSTDAAIDLRQSGGYHGRHQWGAGTSGGPSVRQAGGVGLVGRFKAGLGLGGSSSSAGSGAAGAGSSKTRYVALPLSDGLGGSSSSDRSRSGRVGGGAASSHAHAVAGASSSSSSAAGAGMGAVQMSVVSSVSTPMSSLPASVANGSVPGGRRAVVLPGGVGSGGGAGILGARPRVSGLGEPSSYAAGPRRPTSTPMAAAAAAASPTAGAGAGVGMGMANRTRAFVPPRLGPEAVGPAAGGYGGMSMLSPIVGTPGVVVSASASSIPASGPAPTSYLPPSTLSAAPGSTAATAPTPDAAASEGGGGGPRESGELLGMSMEDRIAEMEKSAEEYFSSGRRWNASSSSATDSDGVGGPSGGGGGGVTAAGSPVVVVVRDGDDDVIPTTTTTTTGTDLVEMQRLAQQQRRGGPRSASEMGVEEARYGS